jgi:hypothetical protein
MKKRKVIRFNEEMERDIEDIKQHFNTKFRTMPSNTDIMKLLLKTYKESDMNIERVPRNKRKFQVIL